MCRAPSNYTSAGIPSQTNRTGYTRLSNAPLKPWYNTEVLQDTPKCQTCIAAHPRPVYGPCIVTTKGDQETLAKGPPPLVKRLGLSLAQRHTPSFSTQCVLVCARSAVTDRSVHADAVDQKVIAISETRCGQCIQIANKIVDVRLQSPLGDEQIDQP